MKYTYIELNHYKRMPLTDSEHFSMTIEDHIQLILGTNGSGKSCLVKELSPFPPNQSDFYKNGSKVLWIEHNNAVYTLKTVFSPSTKHSFCINDNTNLNEGGTLGVQKDLIKQHFNMTVELNELLHDQELFTEMSPSRRKEWFLFLCETDYTYAIKVYNKLKEKHRDASGALKIAKKRLASEIDKVLKTEDEARIHSEVTELHSLLSHLLEYRKPIESDTATLDIEIDRINDRLQKVATQMQSLLGKDTPYSHYSNEQLQTLQNKIQQKLSTFSAFMDDYTAKYSANESKISVLQQAEQNTIDSLEEDLRLSNKELSDKLASTMVNLQSLATYTLGVFQNLKPHLTEIFTTIADNPDKRYNSESLKEHKQKLIDHQNKKQKLIEEISSKQAKLKHLLQHKNTSLISCTKCHHKFSLVYSEEGVSQLESDIQSIQTKIDSVNIEISNAQAYIDSCLEYSALYRQYIQITQTNKSLEPYWDYIKENNIITHSPKEGIHLFNKIESDIKIHVSIQQIKEKIQKDNQLLKSLKEVGSHSLYSLLEDNKTLYAMVATITNKIASNRLKLDLVNKLIERRKTMSLLETTINTLLDKHNSYTKDYIETMRRTALNALIKQLQSELGSKEHILMLASNQKSVIRNIEEQIVDLETDTTALNALITKLSPTDGLIAQGLLGFINNYVLQMNEFIEKVWSYPMIIQSCDVQDNESLELDYRFPVKANENTDETPDVSKCSKGMKEIINLAYKVTAMKSKGLLDSPLYLDEFSSAMDGHHRAEAVSLIKAFSEQLTFSQMFIVSHDVTQYNSLPNAQVCVLSDSNIITPGKYNEHVTFK